MGTLVNSIRPGRPFLTVRIGGDSLGVELFEEVAQGFTLTAFLPMVRSGAGGSTRVGANGARSQ